MEALLWRVSVILLAILSGVEVAHAEPQLTLVTSTASPAPGATDATMKWFQRVQLAEGGQLAWIATLTGGTHAGQSGVWRLGASGTEPLFIDGMTLPPLTGPVTVAATDADNRVPALYVDAAGDVTLLVSVGAGHAIVTGGPDHWQVVAAVGANAPETGVTPATFSQFRNFYAPGSGVIAFEASVTGTGVTSQNPHGIWIWSAGTTRLLVRTGDPAPGYPNQFFDPMMKPALSAASATGKTIFAARRTGDQTVVRDGLWSGTSSADLSLTVALDPPTVSGKVTFGLKSVNYYVQQVTTDGRVLVASSDSGRVGGIWSVKDNVAMLLLGSQMPTPGLAGAHFVQVPIYGAETLDPTTQPSFSPAGRFAFAADATDDHVSNRGVWSGNGDGARLLAWGEQEYQGVAGFKLHGIKRVETNDKGQVALDTTSWVTGTTTEKHLLVRYTPGSGFEKVLAPDSLVHDSGTDRAVTSFQIPCGEWPTIGESCQDSEGRIVILATFADGSSGLLLSDIQPAGSPEGPQPTSVGGAAGGGGNQDGAAGTAGSTGAPTGAAGSSGGGPTGTKKNGSGCAMVPAGETTGIASLVLIAIAVGTGRSRRRQ